MLCESCKIEIAPAWKNIILSNICPACGNFLMSPKSKEIMDKIKEAIVKMSGESGGLDPEGLAGWIMSTFDLFPKGSIEPTVFHGKKPINSSEEPVRTDLKWANNQFAKNAGVDKIIAKNSKFNTVIDAVNSIKNGNEVIDPKIQEEDLENEDLSPEDIKTIIANEAKTKGGKINFKDAMAAISGDSFIDPNAKISEDEKQLATDIVSNMFNADESSVLNNERMKKLRSQYNIQNGAGGFRRGE